MKKRNKIIAVALAATLTVTLIPMNFSKAASKGYYKKEESVFVNLSGDGTVKESIVSVHLKNKRGKIDYLEKEDLKDVKNLKGDEKPKKEGKYTRLRSNKSEIFYQGKSDRKVPVNAEISYKLDGEEISLENLKGKSGKVEISIRLENNDTGIYAVGGGVKRLYTPYTVASVVAFTDCGAENIKIKDGKVLDFGEKKIASKISFPGLEENIGEYLKSLDINTGGLLDTEVVVSADVKKFKAPIISMIISSEIPSLDSMKSASNVGDLSAKLKKLDEGSRKLEDGSKKLKDGISVLGANVPLLVEALGSIEKGSKNINNGSKKLDGAVQDAKVGAGNLSKGSKDLYSGIGEILQGTKAFNDKINGDKSDEIENKINTLIEKGETLDKGMEEAEVKYGRIESGVKNLSYGINKLNMGVLQMKKSMEETVGSFDDMKQKGEEMEKAGQELALEIKTLKEKSGGFVEKIKNIGALINGQKTIVSNEVKQEVITSEKIEALEKHLQESNDEKGVELLNAIKESEKAQRKNISFAKEQLDGVVINEDEFKSLGKAIEIVTTKSASLGQSQIEMLSSFEKMKIYINSIDELSKNTGALSQGAENLSVGVQDYGEKAIKPIFDGNHKYIMATTQIAKKANIKNVANGIDQLTMGIEKLYMGAGSLSAGNENLYIGLKTLKEDGSAKLVEGTETLYKGTKKLGDKSLDLKDGVLKLQEGSDKLYTGILEFNKEGIDKINTKARIFINLKNTLATLENISKEKNSEASIKYILKVEK